MLLTCLRAEGAEFRDELMAGKYNRQRWDDALSRIDATAFESLIADYFRGKGYRVEHVGAAASGRRYDGGIDLKLYRDGEYVLVQCKHWNAFQVPHNAVHELLGIVMTERASAAILVSSGEFTEAAKTAAAKSGRVQLIDGAALRILLEPAQILPNFVAAQRSPVARRAPVGSWQGVLGRVRSYVRMAKLAGGVLLLLAAIAVSAVSYRMIKDRLPGPRASIGQQAAVSPIETATPPAPRPRSTVTHSNIPYELATHSQAAVSSLMRAPDVHRPINREAARAAARKVPGVLSANWMDKVHLIVRVDSAARRSMGTIDEVCHALAPLGDTMGVVIALQNAKATNRDELESITRNCRLPQGQRALFQQQREVDAVSPELRAQFKAMQQEADGAQ